MISGLVEAILDIAYENLFFFPLMHNQCLNIATTPLKKKKNTFSINRYQEIYNKVTELLMQKKARGIKTS